MKRYNKDGIELSLKSTEKVAAIIDDNYCGYYFDKPREGLSGVIIPTQLTKEEMLSLCLGLRQ